MKSGYLVQTRAAKEVTFATHHYCRTLQEAYEKLWDVVKHTSAFLIRIVNAGPQVPPTVVLYTVEDLQRQHYWSEAEKSGLTS